jgi:hypothetical protein
MCAVLARVEISIKPWKVTGAHLQADPMAHSEADGSLPEFHLPILGSPRHDVELRISERVAEASPSDAFGDVNRQPVRVLHVCHVCNGHPCEIDRSTTVTSIWSYSL